MNTQNLYDKLNQSILNLRKSNYITSITDNGNGLFAFSLLKDTDLVKNDFVDIVGSNDFNIVDNKVLAVNTKEITLKYTNNPTITINGKVLSKKPLLHIGTWEWVNSVRKNLNTQKFPFVLIPEEELNINPKISHKNIMAWEVSIGRMFFLINTDWDSSEAMLVSKTNEMTELMENFIKMLRLDIHIYSISDFSTEIHKRFGLDFKNSPLSEHTSGVEVRNLTLSITNY
jgi:hypothetical protein